MNGKILKEWDIPLGKKGKSMTSKRKRKRKRIISENLGEEQRPQMNSNSALWFLVGKGKRIISKTNFVCCELKPYKTTSKIAG